MNATEPKRFRYCDACAQHSKTVIILGKWMQFYAKCPVCKKFYTSGKVVQLPISVKKARKR